jgi:hypothetical protein
MLSAVLSNGSGRGREILVSEGYVNRRALGSFHDFSAVSVACAGLGKSASLGSLSIPLGWAMAAVAIEPFPLDLSETSDDTAPVIAASRPPGLTFQGALMGMMTGRGAVAHATDRDTGEEDDEANDED